MDNPFGHKIEINIHPDVLRRSREILQYMFQRGHPSLIPQISEILLSNPFESSRFDDLVLMVMDNRQLLDDLHYRRLAYMVMKAFSEYDLDPPTSDYVLVAFTRPGFKIYEILEKYPTDKLRKLDPGNLGRAIVNQLCIEYMVEEGFLEENDMHFQIYLYQRGPRGEFLRLYFQRSEPVVSEEQKNEMIKIRNAIFEEWDKDKPFRTNIDSFTQDET